MSQKTTKVTTEKPRQQQQLSVDEQISLILAHTNRSINQVSKEVELAVMKVVSQSQEGARQYGELMKKYLELKEKYEPEKKEEEKKTEAVSTQEPDKPKVEEQKT